MEDPPTFAGQYPSLLPAGDNADMPLIELRRPLVVLGAREDAHVQLKSHTVSRTHAVIVIEASGAYIHDLASREGVFVNRQQIHDTVIEDGDEIRIGRFEFIFQAGGLNASMEPPRPAPAAHLRIKGDRFPLAQRVTSLGRRQGMDVILDDEAVSATHALIYAWQGAHLLRDLNSRTGVFLNGKLIGKKMELRGGDVIRIGPTTMRYVLDPGAAQPLQADAAHDGMSAAMMEVVVADEPDVVSPPPADEAPPPAPGARDEPTSQWNDAGDSDGLAGVSEPAVLLRAPGTTALLEPPGRNTTGAAASVEALPTPAAEVCLDGPALAVIQEHLPRSSSGVTPVIENELHHIILQNSERSPLVIPAADIDRCLARLLPAREHPLYGAAEVGLPATTVVLANVAATGSAPCGKPPPRVSDRPKAGSLARPERPATQLPTASKPKKSKYTASGEYRIEFDDDDEDDRNDPRAAMQRTAVAFMQDSIIGMPVAEVEAAPDPFTLGEVFRPHGSQLPGLILSYRLSAAGSGPNRRPPAIPPRGNRAGGQ